MPHDPSPYPDELPCASREHAFSIVEVVIAMFLVTTVMAAGVLAVTNSERSSRGAAAMQHVTTVAQRAIERAEGDLQRQSTCNDTLWKRDTPPVFRPCAFSYGDLRDSQGRVYRADLRVTPVDDPSDGVGRVGPAGTGGDSDFNSRDRYRVDVTVSIPDANARAALPAAQRAPYSMSGGLRWSANEDASFAIHACSHYRMDRSVDVARCGTADHVGVAGVRVTLTPVRTAANGAVRYSIPSGANGTAAVTNVLPPGDYRVSATDVAGYRFYRASPEFLKVEAGARYDVSVIMVPVPGRTVVCYRITTPETYPGFGHWVNEANFAWQEDRSLVYRNGRLTRMGNARRCQTVPLPDPLGYDPHLFLARYAVSLEQQPAGTIARHPANAALRVQRVTRDCLSREVAVPSGSPGNTVRFPGGWLGTYPQLAGSRQLCIDYEAYPIQQTPCPGPGPGCVLIRTCRISYSGPAMIPVGIDPCRTIYAESTMGAFNPCPGGRSGPLQQSGPNPLGTYRGPVLGFYGSGMATYYAGSYECRLTASGERFDLNLNTASTLARRGYVGYGWGTCVRVWTPRGEAIIKLNDTGSRSARPLLDLSPGSTVALGYVPRDNPRVSAEVVQSRVPNGSGCSAWGSSSSGTPCRFAQLSPTASCNQAYPPQIVDVWVRPEAPAGSANAPGRSPLGNSGGSRRSL